MEEDFPLRTSEQQRKDCQWPGVSQEASSIIPLGQLIQITQTSSFSSMQNRSFITQDNLPQNAQRKFNQSFLQSCSSGWVLG